MGLLLMFGLSFISSAIANPNCKDSTTSRTIEIKITGQNNDGSTMSFDTTIINPVNSPKIMRGLMSQLNEGMAKMRNVFCHYSKDPDDSIADEDCFPPLEELDGPDDLDTLCGQIEKEMNFFEQNDFMPRPDERPFTDEFPVFQGEKPDQEQGINLNDPNIVSYQKTPVGNDEEKIVIIRKKGSSTHAALKSL